MDIFDIAVEHIANDDYNHIPEATLRERLANFRNTHVGTRLLEVADLFLVTVLSALTEPGDPEYGEDEPVPTCDICGEHEDQDPTNGREYNWNGETGNHLSCEETERVGQRASKPKAIKTVIELVVYSDDPIGDNMSTGLEVIVYQMEQGDYIGDWTVKTTEVVEGEALREQLVAIGNDGAFFDGDE